MATLDEAEREGLLDVLRDVEMVGMESGTWEQGKVTAAVEDILTRRLAFQGLVEHQGPHACFQCGVIKAMAPLVAVVKASQQRRATLAPPSRTSVPAAHAATEEVEHG